MSLIQQDMQRGNILEKTAKLEQQVRELQENLLAAGGSGTGESGTASDLIVVSGNDALAGVLIDKLIAGSGVTLTELNDGAYETLGVGIEAHISQPDAHHPPVTGGSGVSVSGQTVNVGAGAGITVNADDVALTTPGTITATSTNTAAGNHTHVIDTTIARSAVTVTGTGALGGGGNLTANRTITMNTPGSLTATSSNSSATNHTHVIDSSIARSAINIIAGYGLVGGGDLTTSKTLHVGGGDGITISADGIALTTPGTITATSTNTAAGNHTHVIDTTIARSAVTVTGTGALGGGGDLTTNRTISMNTPGSLTATSSNASATNHTHAIDSTIARSAINIIAGAGLTGGGDLTTSKTINVGAGAGLTVNADDVALATPGTITATSTNTASGNHTHSVITSSNPGTTSSILKTDNSGYLQIVRIGINTTPTQPLDVNGNAQFHADIFTDHHASRTTGWQVSYAGVADFRNIFADSLDVQSFITDNILATAGTTILTKSLSTLSRDFTVAASATIYVFDLPGSPDTAVFANGDTIRLRYIDRSSGITVADSYGTVSSYADLSGGEQSYTFTKISGTNGQEIYAGSTVLDYGVSGAGFILSTVADPQSPYTDIRTWTTTVANDTTHTRFGQLEGITAVDEYGIYSGISTTQKLIASDGRIELHGAKFSLYSGATERIRLDPAVPSLAIGSTLPTAYADDGIWMGIASGVGQASIGTSTSYFRYDGTKIIWKAANSELDASGNLTATNATLSGEVMANTGKIGGVNGWVIATTSISSSNIEFISGIGGVARIDVGSGSSDHAGISSTTSAGEVAFWAGANFFSKASAPFMVTSDGTLTATSATISGILTINGGSSLAGAVSLGASGGIYQGTGTFVSPTTGLKLWSDSGIGRIAGFNAGVEQVGFDTAGKFIAGGGSVTIDENGISVNDASIASEALVFRKASTVIGKFTGTFDGSATNVLRLLMNPAPGYGNKTRVELLSEGDLPGNKVGLYLQGTSGSMFAGDRAWLQIGGASWRFGIDSIGTYQHYLTSPGNSRLDIQDVIATGDISYTGDLVSRRASTDHTGYIYIPYTAKKTSTSWDGDAKTSSDNGSIDLSAVFGIPDYVRAVNVRLSISSTTVGLSVGLGPFLGQVDYVRQTTQVASRYVDASGIVNCNSSGDFYFRVGGAGTVNVYIEIYGYFF